MMSPKLTTWDTEDLTRELKQLEQRTAQQLDPKTGRLRHWTFDEFDNATPPTE